METLISWILFYTLPFISNTVNIQCPKFYTHWAIRFGHLIFHFTLLGFGNFYIVRRSDSEFDSQKFTWVLHVYYGPWIYLNYRECKPCCKERLSKLSCSNEEFKTFKTLYWWLMKNKLPFIMRFVNACLQRWLSLSE